MYEDYEVRAEVWCVKFAHNIVESTLGKLYYIIEKHKETVNPSMWMNYNITYI